VIGFQGEHGAFSDAAARRLRPGTQTRGYESFDLLVAAVAAGEIDAALLPVENSIAGSIARAYDLLWDYPQLSAVAETAYPVEMNLIGTRDADEAHIREIRSHPVALEQIHRFFTRFYLVERTPATGGPLACVAIEVQNRHGSLRDALSAFADRAIDLRNLVARPNHVDPFHYRFFFEIGTVDRERLDAALAAIDGTTRIIGTFSHEPASR
jgi:prephenate dehydratase